MAHIYVATKKKIYSVYSNSKHLNICSQCSYKSEGLRTQACDHVQV